MNLPIAWVPALAGALEDALHGGRIVKIRSPRPFEVLLTVRAGEEKPSLLLCAHRTMPRAHLAAEARGSGEQAGDFALSLRRRIQGGRIESVLALPGERILEIGITARGDSWRLVFEAVRGRPNVILTDGEGRIAAVLRISREEARKLAPGAPWLPPPSPPPADPAAAEPPPPREEINSRIEALYRELESTSGTSSLAATVRRHLKRLVRKEEKRRFNLSGDFEKAGDPESHRRFGELLKIHSGRVEKGALSVEVPDLFSPGSPPVSIPLDPRLDLEGNMEAWFRKYRRARDGRRRIAGLLEEAEKREGELRRMLEEAQAAAGAGDVQALEAMGRELGIEAPSGEKTAPKKRREPEQRLPYRRFVSAEGFPIWVGRDDAENDMLSGREARGRDLWLHVDGWGGSHVLVRLPRGRTASRETLLDAANLAAFFSQAKGRRVEVSYTEAKNVRKPKGAKAGLVTLSRRSSVRVSPDAERLTRLLGKPPAFR